MFDIECGYNVMIFDFGVRVNWFIMLFGYGFVMLLLFMGFWVGGVVEFGGLKFVFNWKWVDVMVMKVWCFFFKFIDEGGKWWMGYWLLILDSLFVIGFVICVLGVFYVFGYVYYGLI